MNEECCMLSSTVNVVGLEKWDNEIFVTVISIIRSPDIQIAEDSSAH